MSWTAVLLAGARPGGDPMAQALGCDYKPLLPVAGEPMLLRPVRTLLASPEIGDIHVMTQQPERLAGVLPKDPRIHVRPSAETIASTLAAICNDPATEFPVLVTTADHALLTPEMVAQFTAESGGCDIGVAFVDSENLLARFPESQRTWLQFGGAKYSGANLFALNTPQAALAIEEWRGIEQDRKRGWRVLAQLGPQLFMAAVLRLHDIHRTAAGLGKKLGIVIKPVIMRDPLAAIDVDKPSDHQLVEAILAGQA